MNELQNQLSKLLEKKKKHQFSLKELNDSIKELKNYRDKENARVKEYKKLRSEALKKVNELHKKLSSLQKHFEVGEDSNYFALKKDYDALNWKYQTEVFSPRVEKRIVAELDELERRMLASKEAKQAKQKLSKIYKKLKKARAEANHYHEMVVNHARESEKHHQALLKLYDRKDAIKERLKEFDAEINSIKRQLNERYAKIKKEGKQAKEEMQEYKRMKDNAYRKKLKKKAAEALEKFKKGKKVTIEELALIEEFKLG